MLRNSWATFNPENMNSFRNPNVIPKMELLIKKSVVRFQISTYFEVWHLLEGDAYFDLSVNGPVLITGQCLFEVRLLLEKIQYSQLEYMMGSIW